MHANDSLATLLPDSVQQMLPRLLEKYGHPEESLDPDAEDFIHQLLPGAFLFDHVGAAGGVFEDVAGALGEFPSGRDRFVQDTANFAHASQPDTQQSSDDMEAKRAALVQAEADAVKAELAKAEEARERHAQDRERHAQEMEATRKAHEELMRKSQERMDAAEHRRAVTQERHAKMGEHVAELLKAVHDTLEAETHGFQDAPLWDDFFRNTSTQQHWSLLTLSALSPAVEAAALQREHRALVLEPSKALGLAARLAGDLQQTGRVNDVEAREFGEELEVEKDFVLELGLLDAMAMGGSSGSSADPSTSSSASSWRSAELRRAVERMAKIVRPGGTWLSVSVVPPSLRVPLLERLARGVFATPPGGDASSGTGGGSTEAAGTHVLALNASQQTAASQPRLRGGLEAPNVANLLLYGDVDPHIFVYRMRRSEGSSSADDVLTIDAGPISSLEGIVAAQRPATREDL